MEDKPKEDGIEHFIVRVTFTEDFIFPVHMRDNPEALMKEFFERFMPDQSHAARDGGKIFGSKTYIDARILKRVNLDRCL